MTMPERLVPALKLADGENCQSQTVSRAGASRPKGRGPAGREPITRPCESTKAAILTPPRKPALLAMRVKRGAVWRTGLSSSLGSAGFSAAFRDIPRAFTLQEGAGLSVAGEVRAGERRPEVQGDVPAAQGGGLFAGSGIGQSPEGQRRGDVLRNEALLVQSHHEEAVGFALRLRPAALRQRFLDLLPVLRLGRDGLKPQLSRRSGGGLWPVRERGWRAVRG